MSRGYPDYFGQSIWPKYGTVLLDEGLQTLDPQQEETILSVSMQGVLVMATIRLTMPTWTDTHRFQFIIDSQVWIVETVAEALSVHNPFTSYRHWKIDLADVENGYFDISLTRELPYKEGFSFIVKNGEAAGGDTLAAFAKAAFYNIT